MKLFHHFQAREHESDVSLMRRTDWNYYKEERILYTDIKRAKDFLEHNLCDFYVFQCNWSNENQLMTIYDEFHHFLCTRTMEVSFYDNAFRYHSKEM